jgi:hypothetical protein
MKLGIRIRILSESVNPDTHQIDADLQQQHSHSRFCTGPEYDFRGLHTNLDQNSSKAKVDQKFTMLVIFHPIRFKTSLFPQSIVKVWTNPPAF